MILDLGRCALWIEVPLLAHDFTERLATVRRPAQHILLCTFAAALDEMQQDPPDPLRMGEEQPDRLPAGIGGTLPPPRINPPSMRKLAPVI